jgi:regulatory protein YycI of two-component signal transduction system YycFG
MDFRGLKLVLVIAFLLLNAFLLNQVFRLQTSVSVYAAPLSDELANAKGALARHHTTVLAMLPVTPPATSPLWTVPAAVSAAKLKAWLRANRNAGRGKQIVWQDPTAVISRWPGDTLRIDLHGVSVAGAATGVSHLLARIIPAFSYYTLLTVYTHKSETLLTYYEMDQGVPLFAAPLQVTVYGHRVVRITVRLQSVLSAGAARPVISPISALLSVADYMDKVDYERHNEIVGIEFGFDAALSGWRRTYSVPMWRIRSSAGTFYVNGYSGEVGVGD